MSALGQNSDSQRAHNDPINQEVIVRLMDWVVSASACCLAMVLVGMLTVASFAANEQFQLATDLLGTPQCQLSTPPEDTSTPQETAKFAAVGGQYDIARYETRQAAQGGHAGLEVHNPKLRSKSTPF